MNFKNFKLNAAKSFAAASLAAAVFTASAPAHADFFKPSKSDQIKLGDQAAADLIKKSHMVNDRRTRELNRVGNKLLDALPSDSRAGWHWNFYMIDSKSVNAFALPGGNIFMYTGLFDKIRSQDELAAVLGHEMTHVYRQHWASMYADQQKRSLGLGVLLGLTKAGKTAQTIGGLANGLYTLKYSRKDEDQADEGGLNTMVKAGYNPQGMLDLFDTLQKSSSGGGAPEFLTDHPLTKNRIAKTQERIRNLKGR